MSGPSGSEDRAPVPLSQSEARGTDECELSVVIPTFNAEETIGAQIDALLSQSWGGDWEIIIADNGSSDDTIAVVAENREAEIPISVVDASEVRGPSHARNSGAAHARGKSIAFCDADDVVGPIWVSAMGEALRTATLVTGPQDHGSLNPEWSQGIYGIPSHVAPQVFADVFPFGPSANLGVRRRTFFEVGGFDPGLRVGEDLDLCMRLWLAHIELVFVPDAVVHYRHRDSLMAICKQAISYGAASVAIVERLESNGCVRPSKWGGTRRWAWLLRHLPSLRSQQGRARWLVVAGTSFGRLTASLRRRTLFL